MYLLGRGNEAPTEGGSQARLGDGHRAPSGGYDQAPTKALSYFREHAVSVVCTPGAGFVG